MNTQTYSKLDRLKRTVERSIPETAEIGNIWEYLGWTKEASEAYNVAISEGIDLRELRALLAPDFSDIVSIVVDGAYGFPFGPSFYDWEGILAGQYDEEFPGTTPKQRLLSVINSAFRCGLDS